MNHNIDILLKAKSLCKIEMETSFKKDINTNENKPSSTFVRSSIGRKSRKKNNVKTHSRPKQSTIQSTSLIKDVAKTRTLKQKSISQGAFPAIKYSKTFGQNKAKASAARKPTSVLKTNRNIVKTLSKSNKTEALPTIEKKVDGKYQKRSSLTKPIKFDEFESKTETSTETAQLELNRQLHNLKELAKKDKGVDAAKGSSKPEKTTGAIPKIIKPESQYDKDIQNGSSNTNRRFSSYNKCEDEKERIINRTPSFHRDRITATLDELDQIMDSEKLTPTSTTKDKKTVKPLKRNKSAKTKRVSKTNTDKDNIDDIPNQQALDAQEEGFKGIDKYLCSLSGGEARKGPDKKEKSTTQAIDMTEKLHTPNVNLNQKSFPQSSNSTTDNDVGFLLGSNVASKISSTQKSISDKWKPKTVIQETEYQNKQVEVNQVTDENSINDENNDSEVVQDDISNKKYMGSNRSDRHQADVENVATCDLVKSDKNDTSTECKNNDDQDENDIIDELSCPICYEALHVPQELDPCKHVFCDPCLRRMADAPRTEAAGCPMCRTEIKSCTTSIELVKKLKKIYPKQYKAREKAEEASGVFDLPLPPTPPKLVNPFSLSEDENAFGSSGGIAMQMPTGQFVVMPLTPTTATVGTIVEMLELAYLSNVLQLLRQRSHNLEEMLLESRRMYEDDSYTPSRFQQLRRERNMSARFSQQLPPARFRLTNEQRSGLAFSDEREERRYRTSSDPLNFNQFMDNVYQMFPFN